MAEQVLNQFRCDKALREECAAIYSAMGMDLNTAFRMFMERTRMVGGLPFPAVLPESKKTQIEAQAVIDALRNEARDVPEMTLEEINSTFHNRVSGMQKTRMKDSNRPLSYQQE